MEFVGSCSTYSCSATMARLLLALAAAAATLSLRGTRAKSSEASPSSEGIEPRFGLVGVGILSKGSHAAQRMTLRETWFQLPAVRAGLVLPRFFVAEPADVEVYRALTAEKADHGDIELLVGRAENYDAVPHQTLAMLAHFISNSSVQWIVKTDDDVFLRADEMWRVLIDTSRLFAKGARIYSGWMVKGARAHRNGKWAVSHKEYPEEYYPEYASGPTYALTTTLARRVVKLHNAMNPSAVVPWLRLEDVAMGLWVGVVETRVRVERRDDRRFYKGRFCVPWTLSVLLEQGRPLFFQHEDVRRAMLQLLQSELASMHACKPNQDESPHQAERFADTPPDTCNGYPAISSGEWQGGAGRGGGGGDGNVTDLECPRGTRLEDAHERVACQRQARDPDDIRTCARWLVAAQHGVEDGRGDAGGGQASNSDNIQRNEDKIEYPPGFLANLFPGGPPSLQRKAEGAVIAEAEQVRPHTLYLHAPAPPSVPAHMCACIRASRTNPRRHSKAFVCVCASNVACMCE